MDTALKYGSNFDGKRFHNVPDHPHAGMLALLKWMLSRNLGDWDTPRSDFRPGDAPPAAVSGGQARVTFVNHSTVLIQLDGLNLLTDPIYTDRASPFSWAGPRRVRPPGIQFDDLPEIHAVLLSHNHYDHLCLKTLRRLSDRFQPDVYTGLGNQRLLAQAGVRHVVEFDWWDSEALSEGISITFVPAQHFSARGLFDRFKTLWGGFVVEGQGTRLYFAADTGIGPHFEEIRTRLGPPDLALLPIGAFRPRNIMGPVHITPGEAVNAHVELGARHSMAIHFGTFPLADDGQREPVELLDRALEDAGLSREDFWVLEPGEGRDVKTGKDPQGSEKKTP